MLLRISIISLMNIRSMVLLVKRWTAGAGKNGKAGK